MLNLKEIEILSSEKTKDRKLCKHCGHSELFFKSEKKICSNCGNYVFKDDKTEFEFRIKQRMLKQKKGK